MKHLTKRGFWLKCAVIGWWSLALGTYIWFLQLAGKAGGWAEYICAVASVLVAGAGFTYIAGLYREDTATFSVQFSVPPLFISSGVIALFLAARFGASGHWAAQTLSALVGLYAVLAIVLGSSTSPRVKL